MGAAGAGVGGGVAGRGGGIEAQPAISAAMPVAKLTPNAAQRARWMVVFVTVWRFQNGLITSGPVMCLKTAEFVLDFS